MGWHLAPLHKQTPAQMAGFVNNRDQPWPRPDHNPTASTFLIPVRSPATLDLAS